MKFKEYLNKRREVIKETINSYVEVINNITIGKHGEYFGNYPVYITDDKITQYNIDNPIIGVEAITNGIRVSTFDEYFTLIECIALIVNEYEKNNSKLYGATISIGDNTYNILHPFTIRYLIDTYELDTKCILNIFYLSYNIEYDLDTVNWYKNKISKLLDIKYNNKELYLDGIHTMYGNNKPTIVCPTDTMYNGNIILPYYSLVILRTDELSLMYSNTLGFYNPNTNIDNGEVCTGTALNLLGAVTNLHRANFKSAFSYTINDGVLTDDYMSIIEAFKSVTISYLYDYFNDMAGE